MKKSIFRLTMVTIAIALIASVFFVNSEAKAASVQTAFVNVKTSLNVRNAPSEKATIIGSLKSGATVSVYSKTKSGWSEIRYKSKKAYVSTKYLKFFTGVTISKHQYKNTKAVSYPQVKGLKSKKAQDKINAALLSHAKESYNEYLQLLKDEKEIQGDKMCKEYPFSCDYDYSSSYSVKYNDGKQLSILFQDYEYTGGAHGMSSLEGYNFTISDGKELKLNNILTSDAKYKAVQKYAYNYMKKHKDIFYVTSQSDVNIKRDAQFYFNFNGITLKFGEYSVAPYAAGTPTVDIPRSVYK